MNFYLYYDFTFFQGCSKDRGCIWAPWRWQHCVFLWRQVLGEWREHRPRPLQAHRAGLASHLRQNRRHLCLGKKLAHLHFLWPAVLEVSKKVLYSVSSNMLIGMMRRKGMLFRATQHTWRPGEGCLATWTLSSRGRTASADGMNLALQNTSTGLTYFFQSGHFWRFNDAMVIMDTEARETAPYWFACDRSHAMRAGK